MLAINNTPRLSIKKIVVATDFTAASRAALCRAIAIATHYGSKIILVHGVQTAPRNGPGKVTSHKQLHDLSDAEWKLATEARKWADVQCEWQLLKGTGPQVVEQFLAIAHIDLILLGTQANRTFHRSAAEHIFRHVRCPVLAVGPSALARRRIGIRG